MEELIFSRGAAVTQHICGWLISIPLRIPVEFRSHCTFQGFMASALESKPWTPRTEACFIVLKTSTQPPNGYAGLRFPHMGDCQNYGPFLGPYYNTGPNLGDPKRDHYFDNPPYSQVTSNQEAPWMICGPWGHCLLLPARVMLDSSSSRVC